MKSLKVLTTPKRYTAFSLAESLIALAVVGIVASVTIPSLNQRTDKQLVAAKVIKYHNTLNSVIRKYKFDHHVNTLRGGIFAGNNTDPLTPWNALKKDLVIIKDCGNTSGLGCFYTGEYKFLNADLGTRISPDNNTYTAKGVLLDGASIGIQDYNGDCVTDGGSAEFDHNMCGVFSFDVNGKKGPNQMGRDFFSWIITEDGMVHPSGGFESKFPECDPKATDANGFGGGCTAKIILDKAMNY